MSGHRRHSRPTFGGPGGAQVIDGPQDEPQGLLLLPGHSQDLHGRLQLGELLGSSLLVLGLQRSEVKGQRSRSAEPGRRSEKICLDKLALECGRIPKALFSARWLKCSSVLRGKDQNGEVSDGEIHAGNAGNAGNAGPT